MEPLKVKVANKKNIEPQPLPDLQWDERSRAGSLHLLYRHVVDHAHAAAAWYVRRKDSKKWGARVTRAGAILLLAVAGVYPILVTMYPALLVGWAAVLVAGAGALVVLDKFYGFSSGWTRYILTHQRIVRATKEFELEWHHERIEAGEQPDTRQTQALVRHARRFMARINDLVTQETEEWTREFQTTLRQLEEAERKAAADLAPKAGAVVVRVEGAEALKDGWKASVGASPVRETRGESLAFDGLPEGLHTVRVLTVKDGAQQVMEDVVDVPAGGRREVTLKIR